MLKRNNIPSEVRNNFVIKQAYKLLINIEVVSLPVDPFAIIESFGWKAYTVTEAETFGVKCPFNLNEDKPAINFKINETGEYIIIYYDEKYLPRLRWTVAHELGHIILGHKNEFPNRLTEAEYAIAEIEANLFAEELLMPTKILNSNLFPKNKMQSLCNVSDEAINKKTQKLSGTQGISSLSMMFQEAEQLYKNMYNYLLELSNYWATHLKETDVTLPTQYKDYIFCDYWAYVKSKMKREDKELFTLLDDSVAFYDNTEMILFVKNIDALRIGSNQKNIILNYFKKYTNTSIRNILSIQAIA
jgi:Zn-dependent peptidase ImmA (M78 family)